MACAHHHFEARQRPEAPECWCHLNPAIWLEVCITDLKACKQVLAKNNSRTKRSNLAKFTLWLTFSYISLSQKYHYKIPIVLKQVDSSKENARRTGNTNWCLCELCLLLAQVTSEHLTFLLLAFESGIWCSHNGSPPVIWIISLYL